MSDKRLPPELIDDLVSQDSSITDSHLKEFHMQLERSLETLEQQAYTSRRATLWAIAAVLICYAFGFVLRTTQEFSPWPYHILIPLWTMCTAIALITAGTLAVRYWSRHRPALERGRIDLQIAMFEELQRQLAAMNQRLGAARE